MEKREVEQVPYSVTLEGKISADKLPEIITILGSFSTELSINFNVHNTEGLIDKQDLTPPLFEQVVTRKDLYDFASRSLGEYSKNLAGRVFNMCRRVADSPEIFKDFPRLHYRKERASSKLEQEQIDAHTFKTFIENVREQNIKLGSADVFSRLPNMGTSAYEFLIGFYPWIRIDKTD